MRLPALLAMTLAAATAALPAPAGAAAPSCGAASRAAFTPVIELYTSEGCDSCPPADRWFAGLKAEAARGTVVPLAFHVDYWDDLGWKDRFDDPAYGARHREQVARSGAKVVYTPQMIYDGREYLDWRRAGSPGAGLPAAKKQPGAELRVAAEPVGPRAIRITLAAKSAAATPGASAFVALYENGLSSDVKAGENRGVVLAHEFVVRRWLGPFAFDAKGGLGVSQTVALPADAVVAHAGVAAVAVGAQGDVLQSVALPLKDCAG